MLLLKKCSIDTNQQKLLIYNEDWRNSHQIDIPDLGKYLNYSTSIFKVELNGENKELNASKLEKILILELKPYLKNTDCY